MFVEAIDRILRDRCTPEVVRAIESGSSPRGLWDDLTGGGFLELLAPAEQDGAGLELADAYRIFALFGRYAIPVPAAQSIAARAMVAAGVRLPDGLLTLAPALHRNADGSLSCPLVPFGSIAEHVLAVGPEGLMLLSCERAERTPTGVFGSLTASLEWSQEDCARRVAGDPGALRSFGAAIHAAMLAGAMDRVFEMSLQFCNDRIQFGKPLGKFQAIQHQLSVMAEQVAACGIAAESAFQSKGRSPHPLAAAIAKARCSEAAAFVANVGHALHGAIGVTAEYDLQLLTRRLHEWRVAHGSETHWHAYIGAQVLASGGSMSDFVREVWEQP